MEAFDTYEKGLIAHVNPYEGKEGENLHFWVREVELAMDAALISTERLRILNNPEDPVYLQLTEYSEVVSKHPPSQLPPDRGVRHEIDLMPGTEYCVTRQWPLPRKQCEVIDAFFAMKAKSGMVRESKSPHSTWMA
ncbi:Pol protein [Phytophthora palmivora]|uniref:Pol protein n=1 Tax=Phytophthora palmivora TaxID=4796 RepID=A0A2P4YHZ5_9STRA|nr:Pol protein [Phytophthora palmivora]